MAGIKVQVYRKQNAHANMLCDLRLRVHLGTNIYLLINLQTQIRIALACIRHEQLLTKFVHAKLSDHILNGG